MRGNDKVFLGSGSLRCDRAFNPFLPRLGKAAAPLSPASYPEPIAGAFHFLGSPTTPR